MSVLWDHVKKNKQIKINLGRIEISLLAFDSYSDMYRYLVIGLDCQFTNTGNQFHAVWQHWPSILVFEFQPKEITFLKAPQRSLNLKSLNQITTREKRYAKAPVIPGCWKG